MKKSQELKEKAKHHFRTAKDDELYTFSESDLEAYVKERVKELLPSDNEIHKKAFVLQEQNKNLPIRFDFNLSSFKDGAKYLINHINSKIKQ